VIPDIDRISAVIAEVAAAEIMTRFDKLRAGDIREKGPGDLVTVADEATERKLTGAFQDILPGSRVVGEEATAADPDLLAHLTGQGWSWVIDPVDGTYNFTESRPFFAVIVALLRDGELAAGWIHDPVAHETVTAAAGEGAWEGSHRLRILSAPERPAELSGVLLSGYFGDKRLGQRVQDRRDRVKTLKSLRSAAHEYLRLARAEMNFLLVTKLMPWDHAAGVLIHREAGGYSAYLDGGDYEPKRMKESGMLLAPDRASWDALHRLLLEDGEARMGDSAR